jgi:hypothetical protein
VANDQVTEQSVAREIQKSYATALVQQGYGYRVCVCDEIPAPKKENLENSLNTAARAINPDAEPCFVLTTSDLAAWANRFPGLVAARFDRPITIARHWQAWQATESAITRNYVLPPEWQDHFDTIQSHLRFETLPSHPVLTVQGVAGVGKTRLVFEAIKELPEAKELVVLTNDDRHAVEAATWLVNSSTEFATVLTQLAPAECSADRLKYAIELIGDRWQGDPERVRTENSDTIAIIRDILARSATTEDDAAFWWQQALKRLGALDPEWAASVAVQAISGEDFHKQRRASEMLSELAATSADAVMEVIGAELLNQERGWRWQIGSKREIITALPIEVVMRWLSRVGATGARTIARHLPYPSIAQGGAASVPELTERVLREYGDDQAVFDEFAVGRHNLEVMQGPLSSHYERDAQIARAFLNHPLPVIRRWAQQEIASAEHSANVWRRREEDEDFEP